MASKSKVNARARRYYRTHEEYRREKIEDRKEYASTHKKEEARKSREYYHSNPEYRRRRIKQVTAYNQAHKSKRKKK